MSFSTHTVMLFELLRTSRGRCWEMTALLYPKTVQLPILHWTHWRYVDPTSFVLCIKSDLDQPHLPLIAIHEEQSQHTAGQFADVPNSKRASLDLSQINVPLPWELSDFPASSASSHMEQFGQLTLDALMTEAFSNAVTVEDVSDTTTLCSWAFSLVLKSNLKGYSVADLDLKLRAGYRHGFTPTEGCRIDNKVLLNVLAELM